MSQQAVLLLRADSEGIALANQRLRETPAAAAEAEKAANRLAEIQAKSSARAAEAEQKFSQQRQLLTAKVTADAEAAERRFAQQKELLANKSTDAAARAAQRQADAATKAVQRENDAWNDALQKSLARYDKQAAAAERAARRESDAWTNAIQKTKARIDREGIGRDGVLPIRPSLQRIEARLGDSGGGSSAAIAGLGRGIADSGLGAVGLAGLAGGVAGASAMVGSKLVESLVEGAHAAVEAAVEIEGLKARLTGVTGSAEEASEKFEELERMTLGKLPSTVREVSEAFISLSNVGLDASKSSLLAYSNIAAQTGNKLGDVASAVQSAGMGRYKSLREYGVKVKEVGDQLQVTFRGQTQSIEASATAIESYMKRLGQVEFAGAAERQMETMGGTLKKVSDSWEELYDTIAKSSLGSAIKASIGSSSAVIDAVTASVYGLFGAVDTKLEDHKKKRMDAERDALDKVMMSWADPTVSARELDTVAEGIIDKQTTAADKALASFQKIDTLLQKAKGLGETQGGSYDIDYLIRENERQYRASLQKGEKTKKPEEDPIEKATAKQDAWYEQYRMMQWKEVEAVRASLDKKEEAERVFYERNKAILEASGQDETEALQQNEMIWAAYWAKIAEGKRKANEDDLREQAAYHKRLREMGKAPSEFEMLNRKFAGQQEDLSELTRRRSEGDRSNPFETPDQLQAQRDLAAKSVEIERERIREIEGLQRQYAANVASSGEAMFGSLAQAAKNWKGETSKEYAALAAVQKGFAIFSAGLNMAEAISNASTAKPWYAAAAAMASAAASGAKIIAMVSSSNYSGAYDEGGYIPSGKVGLVGERRTEIIDRPTMVQGPARVTGGADTARMMGGGGQPIVNLRVMPYSKNPNRYRSSSRTEHQMAVAIQQYPEILRIGG